MFCIACKQCYTKFVGIVDVSPKTVERIVLDFSQKTINIFEHYRQVKRLGIGEHIHRLGKKD